MLLDPPLALKFKCYNQILPIHEEQKLANGTLAYYNILDPKSPLGGNIGRGFAKEPSMYMVTDDLTVTAFSSISAISYLNRLNIPLTEVEEIVLSIGMKEALSILKASLTSSSALINGLNLKDKKPKQEC
ncbi:DUF674 family protein [Quillaja saponaria]|uniref:DUF674 family protein n=1 Tax=Quillaja saponaria TaxID=32244 RepID=A0AAD7LNA6_QUISA|nr:DUF674 family protein [Quillaja saponaria]